MEGQGEKLDSTQGELQELENGGKSKQLDREHCFAADVPEYQSPLEGTGSATPQGHPPHGSAKSLDVSRHASLQDASEHPQEEDSADGQPLPRESSQAAAAVSDVASSSEVTWSIELEGCSFDEGEAGMRGATNQSHADPHPGDLQSEKPTSSRLRSEECPHKSRLIDVGQRELTEQDRSERDATHSRLHSSSSYASEARASEGSVVRALFKSGRYTSNLSLPSSTSHVVRGLQETHPDRVFAAFHISSETPEFNARRRGNSKEGSRRRAATKDLIISALSEQIHHQQRCIQVQESRLFLQERRLHQLERALGSVRMQQEWTQQRQSREHLWQHLQQKEHHRSSSGYRGLHHVVPNQAMHLETTGVPLYPGAQWVDGLVTYFPPRACDASLVPYDEAPASHRLDIARYLKEVASDHAAGCPRSQTRKKPPFCCS